MYPIQAINSAKALASSFMAPINDIRSLMNINLASAKMALPRQLESQVLSGNPNNINTLSTTYTQVYGALPSQSAAPPAVRAAIDMSDAQAQDAMKKAIQLDALAARELEIAVSLHQQIAQSSPGNAPILDAEASAWILQGNACSQSAMAALLRVRSVQLSNASSAAKNSTDQTQQLRSLCFAVFKYIVVAFIVGNWTTFFKDTMSGFNTLAQFIDNSYGGLDLMKDWQTQLSNNWNSNGYNSIWNIITNGGAAIFNALEVAVAYIIFPLAVTIFTVIYTFWGAVVYAVGPLVLALAPSRMVNSMAKIYAQNLVVWNCWVVIYAIFSCLISAVNGNSMTISPFFSGNAAATQLQV